MSLTCRAAARLAGALLFTLSCIAPAWAAGSRLAGRWEGSATTAGPPVVIILDLDQDASGTWAGSAIFPGFGVKGAPLRDVAVNGDEIACAVRGAMGGPKLKAHLTPAGTLEGTYEQAGLTLPLKLQRSGPAQADSPRQSTTIAKALEGAWESTLEMGPLKTKLGLKLANGKQQRAEGKLILVDSGNAEAPVELIVQDEARLELSVPAVNFVYEGQLAAADSELQGTLWIGSLQFPLIWRRAK